MERIDVKSSMIKSAGFDAASRTFEIEFRSGVYQYSDVPQDVFDRFMASDSKGKFFDANIKDKYRFRKLG
jgi:hypothetical protein